MSIECACGESLPTPIAGYDGGNAISCRCGVTYTATIDIGAMWRRQRDLVRDVERLTKILDAAADAAKETR